MAEVQEVQPSHSNSPFPPRPVLEPVPDEWNKLPMERRAGDVYPIPSEEVRHERRGVMAWIEYLGLRAAEFSLGWLRPRALDVVVTPVVWLASKLDRRHSAAADEFIRAALPDISAAERKSIALDGWRHLARVTLRAPRLKRLVGKPLGEHFDVRVSPEVREVIESDQGCVLVSGHLGNWEAIGLACIALGISPVYGIGKAPKNDPLSRHMQRTRENTGGLMLPRKGAMKGAPTVIRAGGTVMMLLDHRAHIKPVWAPFFGRPAACDRSAGVLLRRIGAPIVFFACYEQRGADRRYRLELGTVLRPEDLSGLKPEGIAARINHELEHLIRAEPRQYFWLHDRFKEAPPAFPESQ